MADTPVVQYATADDVRALQLNTAAAIAANATEVTARIAADAAEAAARQLGDDQLAATKVERGGDTMFGPLGVVDATAPGHAVAKRQLDAVQGQALAAQTTASTAMALAQAALPEPSAAGVADDDDAILGRAASGTGARFYRRLTSMAHRLFSSSAALRTIADRLTDSMSGWDWGQSTTTVVGTLRLRAGTKHEQRVMCSGRSLSGDGGGGLWYWDATDGVSADDGGTIIRAGSGTGRWKRLFSGAVSVLWFGAVGDGATDDTPAFTAALAAAAVVHAPARIYAFAGSLTLGPGKRLYGDGYLVWGNGGSKLVRVGAATAPLVVMAGRGAQLDGFYLAQTGVAHPQGIVCLGDVAGQTVTQFCRVSNLFIEGRYSADTADAGLKVINTTSAYFNRLSDIVVTKCGTGFLFKDQANGNVGSNLISVSCKEHFTFDGSLENALGPIGFFGSPADIPVLSAATSLVFKNNAANNSVGPFASETSSGGKLFAIDASSEGKNSFWGRDNEQVGSYAAGWLNDPIGSLNNFRYAPVDANRPRSTRHAVDETFAFADFQSFGARKRIKAVAFPDGWKRTEPFAAELEITVLLTPPYLGAPVSASFRATVANPQNVSGVAVTPLSSRQHPAFASWITNVYLMTGNTASNAPTIAVVIETSDALTTAPALTVRVRGVYHTLNLLGRDVVSLGKAAAPWTAITTSDQTRSIIGEEADLVSLVLPTDELALTAAAVWNPPAVSPTLPASMALVVSGAALGDRADATFSLPLNGLRLHAEVTAANTVSAYLSQPDTDAPAVDLASGTLKVWVRK